MLNIKERINKEIFCIKKIENKRILFDSCTFCNLKCVSCITGNGLNKKSLIGEGYLKYESFLKFISRNSQVKIINFSGFGEPLLNPDIVKILEYAKNNKISTSFSAGTNLNIHNDSLLESLVKFNVVNIAIAIDGASSKTYKKYRVGGDFNLVIRNIKKINKYKKKYSSIYPRLIWQFIIFGHNEHEIDKARKYAEKLGMDFQLKFNWDPNFSPIKDIETVRKKVNSGVISRYEFKNKFDKYYIVPCRGLWNSPRINWNGDVFCCCSNTSFSFGNVNNVPLYKIMNSKKMKLVRKALMGIRRMPKYAHCNNCSFYNKKMNRFLNLSDINN